MKKIVVGICTCDRPNLVRLCVDSLRGVLYAGLDVEVCLVDSGRDALDSRLLSEIRESVSNFGRLTYISIGPRGIARARNEILKFSRSCDADALAFIDDDELAGARWIVHHLQAREEFGADVTTAPVLPVFPKRAKAMNRWVDLHGSSRRVRPGFRTSAATGNVLLGSKALKLEINFDERFSWSGGEDTDYFRRLHDNGITIYKFDQRDVRELVPRSKACWSWYRSRRTSATQQRLFSSKDRGNWGTLVSRAAFYLIASPLIWCAGNIFRNERGKFLRAHAVGSLLGLMQFLLSKRNQFYSRVHDLSDEEMSKFSLAMAFNSEVY